MGASTKQKHNFYKPARHCEGVTGSSFLSSRMKRKSKADHISRLPGKYWASTRTRNHSRRHSYFGPGSRTGSAGSAKTGYEYSDSQLLEGATLGCFSASAPSQLFTGLAFTPTPMQRCRAGRCPNTDNGPSNGLVCVCVCVCACVPRQSRPLRCPPLVESIQKAVSAYCAHAPRFAAALTVSC